MELKYLRTFRTIVNEGGFNKAAEKLNYTQSTITFQVGQLEQELSVALFEKIGRRMVLTKAGEQLVPYVDEILRSVDKLRFFETDLSQCQGSLNIGVGETLLCYRLPSILKEFHQRAPNARLFLQSMNCYDIRNELLNGTLAWAFFMRMWAVSAPILRSSQWAAIPCRLWPLLKPKSGTRILSHRTGASPSPLSSMRKTASSGRSSRRICRRGRSFWTIRLSCGVFQPSSTL